MAVFPSPAGGPGADPARRLAAALFRDLAAPALAAIGRPSIAAVEWREDGSSRVLLPGGGSSDRPDRIGPARFEATVRALTAWCVAAGRRWRPASDGGWRAEQRRVEDLAIVTALPSHDGARCATLRFERAPRPLPSLESLMREGLLDAREATSATEAISRGDHLLIVGTQDPTRHRLIEALVRYLPDDAVVVAHDTSGLIALDPERRVAPWQQGHPVVPGEYVPRLTIIADGAEDAADVLRFVARSLQSPQALLGVPFPRADAAMRWLRETVGPAVALPRLALQLGPTQADGRIDASLIDLGVAPTEAPSS